MEFRCLKKRIKPDEQFYFTVDDTFFQVQYEEGKIYIATLNKVGAPSELRIVSKNDPIMTKVKSAVGADLIIISHGGKLGDRDNDYFSPLHQIPRFGQEITNEDHVLFSKYLVYVNTALRMSK